MGSKQLSEDTRETAAGETDRNEGGRDQKGHSMDAYPDFIPNFSVLHLLLP